MALRRITPYSSPGEVLIKLEFTLCNSGCTRKPGLLSIPSAGRESYKEAKAPLLEPLRLGLRSELQRTFPHHVSIEAHEPAAFHVVPGPGKTGLHVLVLNVGDVLVDPGVIAHYGS